MLLLLLLFYVRLYVCLPACALYVHMYVAGRTKTEVESTAKGVL